MKAASITDLKKELQSQPPNKLIELCLRMAKYKKENKELLTYLIFEAEDENAYVIAVKSLIDEQFEDMPRLNTYLATKAVRKILRTTKKYIKYSGQKATEAELLIYFCHKLKGSRIKLNTSTALTNLYQQQLKLINKAIEKLHEDLQFDFQQELEALF
ncbi:hypothetical protein NF867_08770 [Solitalea sp. MAHUQ-68]|uniref:Uncharacterized protein n=1 Tax=Solitalea agri TaxID=2953739 RepID=A0A9X2F1I1_9SPHI|nr:hypothetical protein [Solitalea agri]MCO4292952.1 hypothetical protein [Solitalea agri]